MLSDLLKWGGKRLEPGGAATSASAPLRDEPIVGSKAFPKFLTALAGRSSPVLLDFGPVIGTNVAYFGEHLGCKLFIEDLIGDIERHARAGTLDTLAKGFADRAQHVPLLNFLAQCHRRLEEAVERGRMIDLHVAGAGARIFHDLQS